MGWPKGAWELFGFHRHLLGLWDVVVDKQTTSSRCEGWQMLQVFHPHLPAMGLLEELRFGNRSVLNRQVETPLTSQGQQVTGGRKFGQKHTGC